VHTIYDFEVRLDKLQIYGYLASQALHIASGNDTFVRLSSTDGILLKNVSLQDAPSQINFFPGGNTPATIGGDNQGAVREDNILIDTGTLTISDPDAGQAAFQTQSGTAVH